MARHINDNVEGINVPGEIISRMENEGVSGTEMVCDFIKAIYGYADGIHIMAMGDVKGTNQIIEFVNRLASKS